MVATRKTGPVDVAPPQPVDDALDIPVEVPDPDTMVAAPIDPEFGRVATKEPALLAVPVEPTSGPVPDARPRDKSQGTVVPIENAAGHPMWRIEPGENVQPEATPRAAGGGFAAFAKNKRTLAIAGGAAVLLGVVLAFAMGGSSKSSSKPATTTEHEAKTPTTKPSAKHTPSETAVAATEPGETAPSGTEPSETPSRPTTAGNTMTAPPSEPPTETPPVEQTPPPSTPTETSPAATPNPSTPAAAKPKKPKTLGGKKVVLEYDNQAKDAKPVENAPQDDQAAISKARISYAAGNTRLFAGDPDGAIRNYRQALAYYPAYIAGYRGLGLAYAQKRDKANAVKALNTYLTAVPNAKDAALIRKRIETLSK